MKKYILALILFISGIGCMAAYNIIGSEVAAAGPLVEPFFLIPISLFLMAIGILIGLSMKIVALIRGAK